MVAEWVGVKYNGCEFAMAFASLADEKQSNSEQRFNIYMSWFFDFSTLNKFNLMQSILFNTSCLDEF